MALISVLAMVAILALTVVAFVTTMRMDHSASFSYSQSFKADQLAQGGAWWVVGELRAEMSSGAAPDTNGGFAVYTNVGTTNAAPLLVGTNAAMPSLVKISLAGTASYPDGTVIPGSVGAATKSLNGRSVPASRWNAACLGTFPGASALPAWIVVTRSGPSSLADVSKLRDPQDATNYAVGRFAYAVYDEGGLLDVSVAGHPSSFADGGTLSAAEAARRGSPGMLDLTVVPGLGGGALDALLRWRGAATTSSTNAFLLASYPTNEASTNLDAVLAVTNAAGTVTNLSHRPYVAPGDNAFLSRQDLIAYAQSKGLTDALPYLTTFSRDLNAPSFFPAVTNVGGLSPAAQPAGGYPNAANPNVLLVRDSATGASVVRQRFSLGRLALFDDPVGNAAAIQGYFGLTRDGDGYSWDYRSPTTILTLAQVAALHRDPDFFELLQAAVLNGSLVPYQAPYFTVPTTAPLPTATAIIKLGADLIDQYDADSMPTVINFNSEKMAGVENLPYFTELLFWPYRPTSDAARQTLEGFLLVELWNPHQNATALSGTAPSQLRCVLTTSVESLGAGVQVIAAGRQAVTTSAAGTLTVLTSTVTSTNPPTLTYPGSQSAHPPAYIVFNNSTTFAEPHLIDPSLVNAAGSPNWASVTEAGGSRGGFLILSNSLSDARVAPYPAIGTTNNIWTNLNATVTAIPNSANSLGVRMEFKDSQGGWQPYQGGPAGNNTVTNLSQWLFGSFSSGAGSIRADDKVVSPFAPSGVSSTTVEAFTNFSYVASTAYFLSDPRSILPGLAQGESTVNQSIRPGTTAGARVAGNYRSIPATNSYSFPPTGNGAGVYTPYAPYVALYNENASNNVFATANGLGATNTFFLDQDGILRPGDGVYGSNPFPTGSATNRPAILNRPFRSVGEMGYAFRGSGPWKTIDFFSAASADAGLLDYFSVDASPVVAGRINLNTRQPVSLQAALQGAFKTEDATPTALSAAEAQAVAAALTNATARASFVNRADLVRAFSTNAVFTDVVKTRREAAVRALADVGTTRTWCLLVDVVAQVGHYPPAATDPAQFAVEGERRCWLHVAIDRFTGKIVDARLEPFQD